jgi:hypothetical protein
MFIDLLAHRSEAVNTAVLARGTVEMRRTQQAWRYSWTIERLCMEEAL